MDSFLTPPLSQRGRLLQLTTALGDDALLALRVHATEMLGRVPRVVLDVVVQDPDHDPQSLIDQDVCLRILQDDGTFAVRHGWVEQVNYLGSATGLHDWQMVFAPWFHLLEFRRDCRIWQDLDLPTIFAQVFSGYQRARGQYRFELRREYPPLSYVTQFNESDADFVQRWCEQEGIFWYVEHTHDAHCIVFTDSHDTLEPLRPGALRFHTQSATEQHDSITEWSTSLQVHSGRLHWRSNDYLAHGQRRETVMRALPDAAAPVELEQYDYLGQFAWQNPDHAQWLGCVRMEHLESRARRVKGQGGVRQMCAGRWFELTEHPLHDRLPAQDRQFLLIGVEFFAESNLPIPHGRRAAPGSLAPLLASIREQDRTSRSMTAAQGSDPLNARRSAHGFYLNRFEAQPRSAPYRSAPEHHKPAMPGPQTAVVVTPQEHEVLTDRLNRVCVRFHWDRQAGSGELGSCWIRMLQNSSGPDWGSVHVPRAGEEVVVTFLDNDIDRPLILGQVYGGHAPAWHGSGAMSGYKSKELKGRGFNQWVMDDTPGQLRTQLHSSHGHTQLNLGYLINQQGNQRGGWRGSGFELRSDDYGAVRAQRGLHLSTWKRSKAQGGQIDSDEARQQLEDSEQRLQARSDDARQHNADSLEAAVKSLQQLHDDVGFSVSHGDGSSKGMGRAAAFQQPLMLLSAPHDIVSTSARNTQLHSAGQTLLTTGDDLSLASDKSLLVSVAQSISLFAKNAGAKLFAAKGKVVVQAQSDAIEVTAQQDVTITSTGKGVHISAQDGILLSSGGAYIHIKDGNIKIHTPNELSLKAATRNIDGPTRLDPTDPIWPEASIRQALSLRMSQTGAANHDIAAGMPYRVFAGGALVADGIMDESGAIKLEHHVVSTEYVVQTARGDEFVFPVQGDFRGEPDNAEHANRGRRRHQSQPHPDIAPAASGGVFRGFYAALNQTDTPSKD